MNILLSHRHSNKNNINTTEERASSFLEQAGRQQSWVGRVRRVSVCARALEEQLREQCELGGGTSGAVGGPSPIKCVSDWELSMTHQQLTRSRRER